VKRFVIENRTGNDRLLRRYFDRLESNPRPCDEGVIVISAAEGFIEAPDDFTLKGFGPLTATPLPTPGR
jgi:hypothetical protein